MEGVIDLIEAIYDLEAPSEELWLRRIAASAGVLDAGLGVSAYTYDASDPARFRLGAAVVGGQQAFDEATLRSLLSNIDPAYVAATWRSLLCAAASETPGVAELPSWTAFRALGVHDILAINGLSPNGLGLWLGAFLPKQAVRKRRERAMLERLATHLAAAYRLRVRLGPGTKGAELVDRAEAVIAPAGKVEHASGEATAVGVRTALREAVRTVERARGKQRSSDPERSVEDWRALVDARWSLVDSFQSDGKRFVLACRNEAAQHGVERLSARERQVAALAALGRTDKVIAYELGVAHATVRVLVARAARKLGTRTRAGLVRAYLAESTPRG